MTGKLVFGYSLFLLLYFIHVLLSTLLSPTWACTLFDTLLREILDPWIHSSVTVGCFLWINDRLTMPLVYARLTTFIYLTIPVVRVPRCMSPLSATPERISQPTTLERDKYEQAFGTRRVFVAAVRKATYFQGRW